jgi:TRAP-type C4-dicarboxylate transport system permease small subunit
METLHKLRGGLERLNGWVDKVAVNLSWIMLLIITLLNIVQVFYRYVLNNALSWSEEASLWMMVWITFLMLPVAYHRGLNISMMFFRDRLNKNRLEYLIRCCFHLVVIVIAVVCFDQAWKMYKGGFRIEMPALEITKAWVYVIMPPAWLLLIIAAAGQFFRDFIGILSPETARTAEEAEEELLAGDAAVEGGARS